MTETMLEPIRHVDATPDDGYVLRILRAYRQNCDLRWSSTTDDIEESHPLIAHMNAASDKRAALLDAAIAKLETMD